MRVFTAITKSLFARIISCGLIIVLCCNQLVKGTASLYSENPKVKTFLRNDMEIETAGAVQTRIPNDYMNHFDSLQHVLKLPGKQKIYQNPSMDLSYLQKRHNIPEEQGSREWRWQDEAKLRKETEKLKQYLLRQKDRNKNRKLGRTFAFPMVKIIINGRSIIKDLYHSITVSYEPQMDVFTALRKAAIKYNKQNSKVKNPFKIDIAWNEESECEVIHTAAGHSNTYVKKWKLRVLRKRGKRLYSGRCIPFEMSIRPGTRIVMKYTRS